MPRADGGTIRLSAARYEDHAGGDVTAAELPEGRETALYPMLGRGHSLSAGIAVGHYKTPLGLMLKTAGSLLQSEAKEVMGRSALAVTLLSRSGNKATFASKWRAAEELGSETEPGQAAVNPEPPDIQAHLERVLAAFQDRRSPAEERAERAQLPGRVPYKLRDSVALTGAVLLDQEADRAALVRRLVIMESGLSDKRAHDLELIDSLAELVECGLRHAGRLREIDRLAPGQLPQLAVAGLLLARRLATDGGDDGPA